MTGKETRLAVQLESTTAVKPEKELNFFEFLREEKEEESKDIDLLDFLVSIEKRMRLTLNFNSVSELAPELALPGIQLLKNVELGVRAVEIFNN